VQDVQVACCGRLQRLSDTAWHHGVMRIGPHVPFLLLLLVVGCSQPRPSNPFHWALLGCWRTESQRALEPDGITWTELHPNCASQFLLERIVTQCTKPSGGIVRYEYGYLALASGGIVEAADVSYPGKSKAVRTVLHAKARIAGDHLYMTDYPQVARPAPSTDALKIETVSVRQNSPGQCRPVKSDCSRVRTDCLESTQDSLNETSKYR